MSDDDPFGGSDRTVLKPSPGGRRRRSIDEEGLTQLEQKLNAEVAVQATGANPILAAATPLLAIGGQLRRSRQSQDIRALETELKNEMRQFESAMKSQAGTSESIGAARYILCGFIDEAILNTPWGADSGWANRTLLAEFFEESYAGEKVFDLIDRMRGDVRRHVDLLELAYVCLSLGFVGKYRVQQNGGEGHEQLRRQLYGEIRRVRETAPQALSPKWRGAEDVRPKLTRYVPIWLGLVLAGVLVLFVFMGFSFFLEDESDPVVEQIASLGIDVVAVVPTRKPPEPVRRGPTLVELLEPRFGANLQPGKHANAIELRQLFPSGSASIPMPIVEDLLAEVAQALQRVNGPIRINGHSDNVPISIRFPSNWKLSEARAQAVADALLGQRVDGTRMNIQGLGDSVPACAECDQDSTEQRALNRRVEIEVLRGAGRR